MSNVMSISNKCCSFELSIHQRILKVKCITVSNIDNNHKCLLSIRSSYYSDLWRIMWHWRLE